MLINVTKLVPQKKEDEFEEITGFEEEAMLLNLGHIAALRNTEYGTQTYVNCLLDDPLVKENFAFFLNFWKQANIPHVVLQDGFYAIRTDMIAKWYEIGKGIMLIDLVNGGSSIRLGLSMDEVKRMFGQKKPDLGEDPLPENVQNLIDEMNNAEENSSGNVEARTDDTPDAPPADA